MSTFRRSRTDANQAAIFKAWRKVGVKYHNTSAAGGGFPDVIVMPRYAHEPVLVEIKDGARPPSERRLTEAELKFARMFPVSVVGCVKCALWFAAKHDTNIHACCGVNGPREGMAYDHETRSGRTGGRRAAQQVERKR